MSVEFCVPKNKKSAIPSHRAPPDQRRDTAMPSWGSLARFGPPLSPDAEDARAVDEIAPPQPSRLRAEAVQPLEARLPHPVRRAGEVAGEEVEAGAAAHGDAHRIAFL